MPGRFLPAWIAGLAATLALAAAAAGADEGYRLSQTCAGCHGTDGAAPGATIPIIGGQDAGYLARSLREYRSGARDSYVMKIVASGFDDAAIDAIADWFAGRSWRGTPTANDSALAEDGKAVTDAKCASCHGDAGHGTERAPRLAGQPADYLILAAESYRTGGRTDEAAAGALAAVTEAEIAAASHFYAGQR